MKAGNDLFRLIKSLDKNEKGYFKKQAQSSGKNTDKNYILLFNAIDSQEDYNEEELLKKFRTQPFIKQFSVAKNYLFELLLKSQRNYRSGSSKFMRLNALMENGEVLFEKGLYDEALKMWDKAATLAELLDEKAFNLDIETWKRRYFVDLKADLWEQNVGPSFERTDKLLLAYQNTFEIQKIYFKSTKFIKTQPYFRTSEQKADWENIIKQSVLLEENEPQDFYGRLYFNYIHSNFHYLSGNEEKNRYYIKKVIQLWEENPALMEAEPIRYIAAINNYLGALSRFDRYDEFIDAVNNFIPPPLTTILQKAIYFEHWWMWKEITYRVKLDMKGFAAFIAETLPEINKYKPYINKVRWMLIQFEIATFYYSNNNVPASLEILDELMNIKDIELRKDVQAHVRILYLIAHYDLENNLILESISRSAKRYLQQEEFYYLTERIFLKYFNKLIYAADKSEQTKILETILLELVTLFNENETEKSAFANFNIIRWLRAKILDIPISELIERDKNSGS